MQYIHMKHINYSKRHQSDLNLEMLPKETFN